MRVNQNVRLLRAVIAWLSAPATSKTRFLAWGAVTVGLASWAGTLCAQSVASETPAKSAEAEEATDQPPELGAQWIRVANDAKGDPLAMQVAIVRYRGKVDGRPVAVDLVGAVHVGDAKYYQQLNKRFEGYDALLYELVAPEGTIISPEEAKKGGSVVNSVQNGMSSMLELEHQLQKVDYSRPNFVHADMSPDQFFKSMENRGEGLLQMYFRMLGQGIAVQSKQAAEGKSMDLDLIRAMFAPDRARRLKIVFANQMTNMQSLLGGMGGEAGSTLITERNKAALAVLRTQLQAGKSQVGIFYGAGHLPDMDKRLREEFSLQPEEITWLTAWDLTK